MSGRECHAPRCKVGVGGVQQPRGVARRNFAAGGQAGQLDEFAKRDFAPLAADVQGRVRAETSWVVCWVRCGLDLGHGADLLAEFGVGAGALGFEFGEAFLVVAEHFFDGFKEGADLGLAFVEGAGGFSGEGFEFFLGHLEESFIGFGESVAGDGGEGGGEGFVGLVEEGLLFGDVFPGGGMSSAVRAATRDCWSARVVRRAVVSVLW